jgi:hypothetical protein
MQRYALFINCNDCCMRNRVTGLWACVFTFVLSASCVVAQSPTKKQYQEVAEKEFVNKNYYGALLYFDEVLSFDSTDTEVIFRSAEAARNFNAYTVAANRYKKVVDHPEASEYPTAVYWLANMNQMSGKYQDAQTFYEMYLSEYSGTDTLLTAKAKKQLESVRYAINTVERPIANLLVEKMSEDVNTPASEVAGFIRGNDFFFSSMNYQEGRPPQTPARQISKLLVKKGKETATLIEGPLSESDSLISNAALSPDGNTIYFTICTYINDSEIRCDLYSGDYSGLGEILNPVKLPAPLNMPGTTSTHPHLAIDKVTGREMLYFVSDRPGGNGGFDIWYCLKDATYGFSEPVNIQSINTPENEITPYYSSTEDALYFSSDGRIGMGGYDVYKTLKINEIFTKVTTEGYPVNGSYHDIYYTQSANGEWAYLSSNREGALKHDSYFEACCYDIFKLNVVRIKLDLKVLTFDRQTGLPLKQSIITLIDKETGEIVTKLDIDELNQRKINLATDRDYIIVAEREYYDPDTLPFTTTGIFQSGTVSKELFLSRGKLILDVYSYGRPGDFPLNATTIVVKNMDDPSAKPLVITNPISNSSRFFIDRGLNYTISASKEGFTPNSVYLDTKRFGRSERISQDIYLNRLQLQDLLPITLYFDNNMPDLGSQSLATKSRYSDLVNQYVGRKEEYKRKFIGPLKPADKETAKTDYDNFFYKDVEGGFDQFKKFATSLLGELKSGKKVELVLKGYASPRAKSEYNYALGQRRIGSIKNELVYFLTPDLLPYFKEGKLVIKEEPFTSRVSGQVWDKRKSVFSLNAARQRKVEIIRATSTQQSTLR